MHPWHVTSIFDLEVVFSDRMFTVEFRASIITESGDACLSIRCHSNFGNLCSSNSMCSAILNFSCLGGFPGSTSSIVRYGLFFYPCFSEPVCFNVNCFTWSPSVFLVFYCTAPISDAFWHSMLGKLLPVPF